MKLLLINPPLTDPFQSPLGMATLAAHLAANGVTVEQRDMSLEFVDFVLERTPAPLGGNVAPATLRSRRFYDLRTNHLASLALFERVSSYFNSFGMDIGDAPELDASFARLGIRSEDDLLDTVADRRANPFRAFFESRLEPASGEPPADLVGVSVSYEWQLLPALTVAWILRRRRPRTRVCVGGPYITYARTRLRRHPRIVALADAFVVFEGEIPTLELLKRPSRKADLARIPNLLYTVGEEVKATALTPSLPAGSAPVPLFEASTLERYLVPEPVLPILATRSACLYGRCSFCNSGFTYLGRNNVKTPERIFEEIEELHRRHGSRHFTFYDDAVPLDVVLRLSRMLVAARRRYRFFAALRSSEALHGEDLRLMRRAGFLRIQFGFESASDRMLLRFTKGRTHADMLRILRSCRRAGISTFLSAFVGFPGERRTEATATIDFFNTENRLFDSASVVPYAHEEGSAAWEHPERFEIEIARGSAHDLFHDVSYSTRRGLSPSAALRLLHRRLVRSRSEPVLGTVPSLLYLSRYGYRPFMRMILKARREGAALRPDW